jgi:polyisoprenoid-binding protein YceI
MDETSTNLTGTYLIDRTHSRIGFVARHAMVTKLRGSFNSFDGEGFFDADNPIRSHLYLRIDSSSVYTGNADRDAHVRRADFLDCDTYPEITFRSTAVSGEGDARYRVRGDLTVKGVTRPVTVELDYTGTVVDQEGRQRVGFEGHATLRRSDWGVTWNAPLEAGGLLVSDKVDLELDVSAILEETSAP